MHCISLLHCDRKLQLQYESPFKDTFAFKTHWCPLSLNSLSCWFRASWNALWDIHYQLWCLVLSSDTHCVALWYKWARVLGSICTVGNQLWTQTMVSHPLEASSVIDGIDSLIDHFEIGHPVCFFMRTADSVWQKLNCKQEENYTAVSWNALKIVRLMHCKVNVTKQKINFSYATHSGTATQWSMIKYICTFNDQVCMHIHSQWDIKSRKGRQRHLARLSHQLLHGMDSVCLCKKMLCGVDQTFHFSHPDSRGT